MFGISSFSITYKVYFLFRHHTIDRPYMYLSIKVIKILFVNSHCVSATLVRR